MMLKKKMQKSIIQAANPDHPYRLLITRDSALGKNKFII